MDVKGCALKQKIILCLKSIEKQKYYAVEL